MDNCTVTEIADNDNAHGATTLVRKYPLENLTRRSGYSRWSAIMLLILEREKLHTIVTGKEVKPPTDSPSLQAWSAKDLNAKQTILMYVAKRQANAIRDMSTAKEMWNYLKSIYEPTDVMTRITTLRRVMRLEMQEDDDVTEFIHAWLGALYDATASGNEFAPSSKNVMLLSTLPASWGLFISVICRDMDIETCDLTDLVAKIKGEGTRRKYWSSRREQSHVTAPHTLPKKFQHRNEKHNAHAGGGLFCGFCNKPGHLERKCRNKRRSQQNTLKYTYDVARDCISPGYA